MSIPWMSRYRRNVPLHVKCHSIYWLLNKEKGELLVRGEVHFNFLTSKLTNWMIKQTKHWFIFIFLLDIEKQINGMSTNKMPWKYTCMSLKTHEYMRLRRKGLVFFPLVPLAKVKLCESASDLPCRIFFWILFSRPAD